MGFRIILNDFMKIVCGLKTGGASAVDGVDVKKDSLKLIFPSSVYFRLCILSDWFYF